MHVIFNTPREEVASVADALARGEGSINLLVTGSFGDTLDAGSSIAFSKAGDGDSAGDTLTRPGVRTGDSTLTTESSPRATRSFSPKKRK